MMASKLRVVIFDPSHDGAKLLADNFRKNGCKVLGATANVETLLKTGWLEEADLFVTECPVSCKIKFGELIQHVKEKLNLEAKIVVLTWTDTLPSLSGGKEAMAEAEKNADKIFCKGIDMEKIVREIIAFLKGE